MILDLKVQNRQSHVDQYQQPNAKRKKKLLSTEKMLCEYNCVADRLCLHALI